LKKEADTFALGRARWSNARAIRNMLALYQPPLWLTYIQASPGGRKKAVFFEKKNQKTVDYDR
jgi:hypothetical protein